VIFSVTSGIYKIAKSFIRQFFNSHFDNLAHINKFGCTNSRSTVHALIKLSDKFLKSSDNSNNIVHILLVDFAKAFDLVNHNVLLHKFLEYDCPPHIIAWSMSFLHERKQCVNI
jgi:Reverse transcriptase (RNA-dependent DNA polymerase)